MPLVLSDESINRYGFRVLTEGIEYIDDEVPMFYDHDHEKGALPIGKLTKLEKKDRRLYAEPVYDTDDEKALEVKRKVDKGFINGASIGFDILEMSDAPEHILKGQTRPTVTRCLLVEGSPTPMRANVGARFLRYKGQLVTLSETGDNSQLNDVLPPIGTKNEFQMKGLLSKLGLKEGATEAEVLEALNKLNGKNVEALIALGRSKGIVTDANESVYRLSATADYEETFKQLNAAPAVKPADTPKPTGQPEKPTPSELHGITLSAFLQGMKENGFGGNQEPTETFETLSKKNPNELYRIKQEEPKRYKALVDAHLGK